MTMQADTLMALILLSVVGASLGNYATSFVYRLPRGESPFARDPYCGDCNNHLQTRDLFPLFSFLLNRGKCRFCGASIRNSYFVIELLCAILLCVAYLKFGFGEHFLLVIIASVFFIITAAIHYHDGFISRRMLFCAAFAGALLRVLEEGTIYGFVQTAVIIGVLSLLWWRLLQWWSKHRQIHLPGFFYVNVVMGICLPLPALIVALSATILLDILYRAIDKHWYGLWACAMICLNMLNPQWGEYLLSYAQSIISL